jgi:macrolide-specific efflux system membrane fusion protein
VLTSGKIKAIKTVDVGAQVSGEITQLYVEIGDQVKKRDLIAQISQIEQKQRLKRPSITISS